MRHVLSALVILVLVNTVAVQAQPKATNQSNANKWRAKANYAILSVESDIGAYKEYRINLLNSAGEKETELVSLKAKIPVQVYETALKRVGMAKGATVTATIRLDKSSAELAKAKKFMSASDTAYTLTLYARAYGQAVEADIAALAANNHMISASDAVDAGFDHLNLLEMILAKYRE